MLFFKEKITAEGLGRELALTAKKEAEKEGKELLYIHSASRESCEIIASEWLFIHALYFLRGIIIALRNPSVPSNDDTLFNIVQEAFYKQLNQSLGHTRICERTSSANSKFEIPADLISLADEREEELYARLRNRLMNYFFYEAKTSNRNKPAAAEMFCNLVKISDPEYVAAVDEFLRQKMDCVLKVIHSFKIIR